MERVLIIEDERELCELLGQLIVKRFNFSAPLIAVNGAEGMELLKEHHDDIRVCVVDYLLPGKLGDKVIEEIRQFDPNMSIIILTGADDIEKVRPNLPPDVAIMRKPLSKTCINLLETYIGEE